MTLYSASSGVAPEPRLVIERGISGSPSHCLVERKGAGHPDTLADQLAEELSRAYSRYTLRTVGAVLHHNFDKLALLGGASEVSYGGGKILDPVRVLVNGRASASCAGVKVPMDELVVETVRGFFAYRLPELAEHLRIELNITANPSPGAVYGGAARPERASWFAPASADGLRERQTLLANDTSFGTGWAPEHPVEVFVRSLTDHLSTPTEFPRLPPWCGSDVKTMASADEERVDVVLCVPQKSTHVPDRTSYIRNCQEVLDECYRRAAAELPDRKVSFRLNTRDIVDHDELYLTYTGSSIESGDEGLVGRGNRVNGLITPLRPMNLEGANGKNPVYHVGKVYNVAARRIAQRLHVRFGGYVEAHLASATGQPLTEPWQVLIRVSATNVAREDVETAVREVLAALPELTEEIIAGNVALV